MEQAGALKAKGVQVVACLSVNDVFVTGEWGRAHNAEGKVRCGAGRGLGQARWEVFLVTFTLLSPQVQLLADPTGAFGKVSVPPLTLPGGSYAGPRRQGLRCGEQPLACSGGSSRISLFPQETDLLLDDALVPLFGNRRLKR